LSGISSENCVVPFSTQWNVIVSDEDVCARKAKPERLNGSSVLVMNMPGQEAALRSD
jgi:hypothetical protein